MQELVLLYDQNNQGTILCKKNAGKTTFGICLIINSD